MSLYDIYNSSILHIYFGNNIPQLCSDRIPTYPSMQRKFRNTRERRYRRSPNRKWISRPDRSLICCTRMSMQEWYRRVLRSDRHSSVCETVAAFEIEGIIPSRRHANDLPATVRSLLRLATACRKKCHIHVIYHSEYNHIYGTIQHYEWHLLIIYMV